MGPVVVTGLQTHDSGKLMQPGTHVVSRCKSPDTSIGQAEIVGAGKTGFMFHVFGFWFIVLCSWFVVLSAWVLGSWFVVHCSWFVVLSAWVHGS
ncbi:hypothetical protein LCGC14_2781310 [marine sediment metagenome]|uniref:Uncharacterized protein n=1 Tax=marine sediment metagenome TaxID=412755 RepID=A0A0F8YT73_9ZZZZ